MLTAILVTIHTLGEELTEDDLEGYREGPRELSGGIEFVVKPTDMDPPVENGSRTTRSAERDRALHR